MSSPRCWETRDQTQPRSKGQEDERPWERGCCLLCFFGGIFYSFLLYLRQDILFNHSVHSFLIKLGTPTQKKFKFFFFLMRGMIEMQWLQYTQSLHL